MNLNKALLSIMRLLCFDSVLGALKTDLLPCEAMVLSNPPLKAGCRKAHVAEQCLLKVTHLWIHWSLYLTSRYGPQWRYCRWFCFPISIALRACYPCSADFWKYLCPFFFFCIPLEVGLDALLLSKPRGSVVVANIRGICFVHEVFYLPSAFSLYIT